MFKLEEHMNKLGRNDVCFCGSGKKFKKCCNSPVAGFEVADFQWRMLRELEGRVFDKHLIPYARYELPIDVVDQAFSDFLAEDLPETIDLDALFDNCFVPWFFFNWFPQGNFGLENFDGGKTVAVNYVDVYEHKLNSSERRFIDAMSETYYSFYSVLEVEFEKTLVVKDILLGTKHTIKEKSATHTLRRGDIIFSRILTLDNQSIFVGMAPYHVPVRFNQEVISFKRWFIEEYDIEILSPVLLFNYDIELIDFYFDMLREYHSGPSLGVINTDGEIIQSESVDVKTELEDVDNDNIIQLPELKEKMVFLAKQYWQNWFDQPIPALENQTPRKASKTEAGRERLEALLLQYEQFDSIAGDTNLFRPDFDFLRSELKLEK